jgi:predicted methyltransferase
LLKNKLLLLETVNLRTGIRNSAGLALLLVAFGCAAPTPGNVVKAGGTIKPALQDPATYQRAVSSGVRSAEDRTSDDTRKPLAFLTFAQVAPGMQILDIAAGGGNTSQLMALVVGNGGRVYAQGPAARAALADRLSSNPQANIVPVVRPYDDPVPPGTPPLDLVTINLNYHDIANLPLDRVRMDRRLFEALKPGGHVVVLDHAAAPGTSLRDSRSLHRIDEALVRSDFQQAGFKVEESADTWRNPADTHQQKSFEMKEPTDRFALRFVKPAS